MIKRPGLFQRIKAALRSEGAPMPEPNTVSVALPASVVHDARRPLNNIINSAAMLASLDLTEEQAAYVAAVESGAAQLVYLMQDFLDITTLGTDSLRHHQGRFALRPLIESTRMVLNEIAALSASQVEVIVSEDAPEHLLGDARRVEQILINLVNNALLTATPGNLVVDIKRGEEEGSRVGVLLTVTDPGPHVNDAVALHVLGGGSGEPAKTDMRRLAGGAWIASRLAASLGGWVRHENAKLGTFRLQAMIPMTLVKAEAKANATGGNVIPLHDLFEEHRQKTPSLKVLVAEDDVTNAHLVSTMLTRAGHEVTVTGTGRDAVAEIGAKRFDLVVMDIHMPDMTGIEVLKILRRASDPPPIIVLTADDRQEVEDKVMDLGAKKLLFKPVSLPRLLTDVHDLWRRVEQPLIDHVDPDVIDPSGIEIISEAHPRQIRSYFLESIKEMATAHGKAREAAQVRDWHDLRKWMGTIDAMSTVIGANLIGKTAHRIEECDDAHLLAHAALEMRSLETAIEITHAAAELLPESSHHGPSVR